MAIQPQVDEGEVRTLVEGLFDQPINGIEGIKGGEMARVYFFRAGSDEYVIRFTAENVASTLTKDKYCAEKFGSGEIPIPRIVKTGQYGDVYYAISERAVGVPSDALPPEELGKLIPEIIKMADAIHQIDVSDTEGYGYFSATGQGMAASWRGFLTSIVEQNEKDFFGMWQELFGAGLLERDLWFGMYDRMVALLDYCPEERWLLHGDYGFSNLLVDEGKITAVIDWGNAGYGDFLQDFTSLILFTPGVPYKLIVTKYHAGREIPNMEERLQCYLLHGALNALKFFAKKGNPHEYEWIMTRIKELGLA